MTGFTWSKTIKGHSSEGQLKSNLLSNYKIKECSLRKSLLGSVKRERDENSWKMQWLLRHGFLFLGLDHPIYWLSGLGRLGKLARALVCPCRSLAHCESHSPLVLQRTHLPNRETMWRNEGAFVNVAHWRDNIKKFFKTKGVILRFHIIRQVYDLSVCKGADGASHTAICLKLAHLSQGISILLSSPSALPCLGLLWCSGEYTQKPPGQLALLALQHPLCGKR